mmetsp:Transcript_9327/g.37810  ORF Transcript_9327/g.37810 Transcript_9327/m.37810 type:complete len:391 (+) Transcript_9327:670-1842(+)
MTFGPRARQEISRRRRRLRDGDHLLRPPQRHALGVGQAVEVDHAHLTREPGRRTEQRDEPRSFPALIPAARSVRSRGGVHPLEGYGPRLAKFPHRPRARVHLPGHPGCLDEQHAAPGSHLGPLDCHRGRVHVTVHVTGSDAKRGAALGEPGVVPQDVFIRGVGETLQQTSLGFVELHVASFVRGVEPEVLRPRDHRQQRSKRGVRPVNLAGAVHEDAHGRGRHRGVEQAGGFPALRRHDPGPEADHDVDGPVRPQTPGLHHRQHARIVARHRAVLPTLIADAVVGQVIRRRRGSADALPQQVLATAHRPRGVLEVRRVVVVVVVHRRRRRRRPPARGVFHASGVLVVSEHVRRRRVDGHERGHHENLWSGHETGVDERGLVRPRRVQRRG